MTRRDTRDTLLDEVTNGARPHPISGYWNHRGRARLLKRLGVKPSAVPQLAGTLEEVFINHGFSGKEQLFRVVEQKLIEKNKKFFLKTLDKQGKIE